MGWACGIYGGRSHTYRLLDEKKKSEGRRHLGRSRHKWKRDIKTHLTLRGWDGVDWIDLAHDTDK